MRKYSFITLAVGTLLALTACSNEQSEPKSQGQELNATADAIMKSTKATAKLYGRYSVELFEREYLAKAAGITMPDDWSISEAVVTANPETFKKARAAFCLEDTKTGEWVARSSTGGTEGGSEGGCDEWTLDAEVK